MIIAHRIDTQLRVTRCYDCGRAWAYEEFGGGDRRCPYCAGALIGKLHERVDKLERSVRAYKAATKQRRGAK